MKSTTKTMAMTFAAIALLAYGATAAQAQILSVQFLGGGAVQSGFQSYTGYNNTESFTGTDSNTYTVVGNSFGDPPNNTEGVLTRAAGVGSSVVNGVGTFTNANLYNSFLYGNGSTAGPGGAASAAVFLTVGGLTAGHTYALTLYAFDPGEVNGSGTQFSATGNTTLISGSGTVNSLILNGATRITGPYTDVNPQTDALSDNSSYANFAGNATGYGTTIDVSTTTGTLNITGAAIDNAGSNYDAARLNGFTLTDLSVPEPSTYALMGLGALALLIVSRRRKV